MARQAVLQICNISGIEALMIAAQFHWTGHVIRMSKDRLPKIIFYSELKDGARCRGGQRKRYKDTLKANLKRFSIVPADLGTLVMNKFIHHEGRLNNNMQKWRKEKEKENNKR